MRDRLYKKMIKNLLRAKRIYFHLPLNNLFISSFSSFPSPPSSFHFSFHFFFFSSFLFLFSKSPKRLLICIAKQPKNIEKKKDRTNNLLHTGGFSVICRASNEGILDISWIIFFGRYFHLWVNISSNHFVRVR